MQLLQPDGWARPRGYSNGVVANGRYVAVAGQIGWDPVTGEFASDDLTAQVRQALRNVVEVLRTAGAEAHHVVRMTWYLTDKAAYLASRRHIGEAYRESFGKHYPAMSLIFVSDLLEDRAKVEIEVTAVVAEDAGGGGGGGA